MFLQPDCLALTLGAVQMQVSARESGSLHCACGCLTHLTHPNPAAPASGLGLRSSFQETSRPSQAHPSAVLCSQKFEFMTLTTTKAKWSLMFVQCSGPCHADSKEMRAE